MVKQEDNVNEEFPDGSLYLTPSSEDSDTQSRRKHGIKNEKSENPAQGSSTNSHYEPQKHSMTGLGKQPMGKEVVQDEVSHQPIESMTSKTYYEPVDNNSIVSNERHSTIQVDRDKQRESQHPIQGSRSKDLPRFGMMTGSPNQPTGKQAEIEKPVDQVSAILKSTKNTDTQPVDYSVNKCIKQQKVQGERHSALYNPVKQSTTDGDSEPVDYSMPMAIKQTLANLEEGHKAMVFDRPFQSIAGNIPSKTGIPPSRNHSPNPWEPSRKDKNRCKRTGP